jgi:hypothetical protein
LLDVINFIENALHLHNKNFNTCIDRCSIMIVNLADNFVLISVLRESVIFCLTVYIIMAIPISAMIFSIKKVEVTAISGIFSLNLIKDICNEKSIQLIYFL